VSTWEDTGHDRTVRHHKTRAAAWFRQLRDDIVAAFEGLEDTQAAGPFADRPPGGSR
jgi:coproporphyrinogen III oxidase